VAAYNASLPAAVARLQAAGRQVHLVDMHAAVTPADLLPDGVHPSQAGMARMAEAWLRALAIAGLVPRGE
jgi:lysophospholipase L1-like esterase